MEEKGKPTTGHAKRMKAIDGNDFVDDVPQA